MDRQTDDISNNGSLTSKVCKRLKNNFKHDLYFQTYVHQTLYAHWSPRPLAYRKIHSKCDIGKIGGKDLSQNTDIARIKSTKYKNLAIPSIKI